MNIGDAIYKYRIELDFIKDMAEFNINSSKILGLHKDYIVLDDEQFTTLQFRKEKYAIHGILEIISTYHHKIGTTIDSIITIVWTTNPCKDDMSKKLKKATEKYIQKEYGKYCHGIKLLDNLKEA